MKITKNMLYIFPLTPDQPPFKGGRYVTILGPISESPGSHSEDILHLPRLPGEPLGATLGLLRATTGP